MKNCTSVHVLSVLSLVVAPHNMTFRWFAIFEDQPIDILLIRIKDTLQFGKVN